MKILVVEDDHAVAQTLELLLSSYNYAVDIAEDGESALEMAEAFEYDLIVLDILLPQLDGISLCRKLREDGLQIPILLVTGQGGGRQKAIALNAGADDYVVKPFDSEELIARVQALLRRGTTTSQPVLTWGQLSLDPNSRQVNYGTHLLVLTPKEYAIAELFLRHPQTVFSARAILDHAWTAAESPGEEAVRVHIKELRQKLTAVGAPKDWIKTVYRVGYRLNPIYSAAVATGANQQPTVQQVAELKSVNEELRIALEELRATQEELQHKNQELAIAYQTIEQERQQLQVARDQAEIALKQSEDKFRHFAENTHTVIWMADPQTINTLYVSPAYETVWGRSRQGLMAHSASWLEAVYPDDVPLIQSKLDKQREGESCDLEYRIVRPDGSIRWIWERGFGIRNDAGQVYLYGGIAEDITQRKQLELSLQSSEAKLSRILDSAIASITSFRVWDNRDWEYEYYSSGCEDLFGYTAEEMITDKNLWFSRVFPTDLETTVRPLYTAFFAGQPAIAEYRFRHKDGTLRWIASTYASQLIEPGCWMVTVVNTDITERKEAEIALVGREAQLQRLAANVAGVLYQYVLHPDGSESFAYISPQCREIYELEAEQLRADFSQVWAMIHPADVERVHQANLRSAQELERFDVEFRLLPASGRLRWVRTVSQPERQADGSVIWDGLVLDITPQKTAEAALQANERRYQQILDAIADMVLVKELGSRLVWANKAFRDYYGMTLAELNGIIDAPFNEPDYTLQYIQDDAHVFATGQTLEVSEEPVTRHDGTVRLFNTIKTPICDENGQVVLLVGVSRDITDHKQAEAQLRQREELLSSIYEGADQAVFVVAVDATQNFHYLNFNRIAEQFAGAKTQELQGKTPEAAFGPEIGASFRQNYERCLQAGTSISYEEHVVFESHTLWTLTTLSPLRNDQGQIYRIVGTAIDITDRKHLELSLQASEAKLARILDSAIATIASFRIYTDHTWKYDYFSNSCETLYGYTPQEFMADENLWLSRIPPEDVATILVPVYQDLYAGRNATAEFRFRHKDGSIRWIFSTHASQRLSENCWQVTVVDYDITDRKRTEAELQEKQRFIEQVTESTSAILYVFDLVDQCNVYVNSQITKVLGYSPEQIQGMGRNFFATLVHPDDLPKMQATLQQCMSIADGDVIEAEYRMRHTNGNWHWLQSRDSVLKRNEDGTPQLMIGTAIDITARKQTELALQQQFSREQLIAEISQDIRRSLDLNEVLSQTVERVRKLLNTDRVIVFRFRPDWQGDVIMESVAEGWPAILSTTISDPCFREQYIEPYRQGRVAVIDDLNQTNLEPCYVDLLRSFQVRASLVVPILQGDNLWGLLIVQHCSAPRPWQGSEIDLLRQLATQAGIAIQQSELYEQTRCELAERARMQAVLEASEERFRTLSAAAPIGICQTNADGICLYTNTRWQEMSGLSFAENLGDGWLQAIHPDDRQLLFTAWEEFLQGGSECLPEFRLLTPDGKVRWVSTRVAAMKSATGEVIGYVGIEEDITDRKLAEQKIREQAALLDIASDAIFVHDFNQHVLYWNRGAERLYGWTAAEAVGQSVSHLLRSNGTELSERMTTLSETGEWRGEIHKVTKAGRQVIVEARWTLVRDEAGQPSLILSVDTDITEQKQLEAQFYRAQRLESLGTLAGGIAHDLNNVLTPILTIAQLLQLKQLPLDPRSQEMLRVLEESARRGATMIKQILTFTRGTDGQRVPLQVAPLVSEVVKVVQQTFPKSITIQPPIPDRSPGLISADSTHLHQVLMNLCVNARDAMPNGGILTLSIERVSVDANDTLNNLNAQFGVAEPGTYVVITVADTGTGISPEIRDRIFDPFFTTKEPGKGTGLGLSTVLGIVKDYGGFVQVITEMDQGSQFKIYLPTIEGTIAPTVSAEPLLHGKGELVLLVDDDRAVQQANQSLLESYQYTTLLANDGIEAIEIYTQHQQEVQVILIDVMMPHMDGVTAVKMLRQINPTVKILAISGLSANRKLILAAGANAFLTKPYTLADLLNRLHNLIHP